jgi:3-polyprenyl-4-hydroxybenzoate decarboxylase
VEWALATRFQADRQMIVLDKEQGSSLDPSAEQGTHRTSKVGFDLTKPLQTAGKDFDRAAFPQVDLSRFLPGR